MCGRRKISQVQANSQDSITLLGTLKVLLWAFYQPKTDHFRLTGNTWTEPKFDNVIVFGVPDYPCRSQFLSNRLDVIAVFRITSGFSATSGLPEVTSPGPWDTSIPLLCDCKRVWVSRTSQFSPNLCTSFESRLLDSRQCDSFLAVRTERGQALLRFFFCRGFLVFCVH